MDLFSIFLAGLGGALVGVAGVFGVQAWNNRREGRAACRALWSEINYNASTLTISIATGVSLPLTVATWNAVRLVLAAYLSPAEYTQVAQVHLFLHAAVEAQRLRPAGAPLVAAEISAHNTTRARIDPVAELLEVRGWPSKADREQLKKALEALPPYTPVSPPPAPRAK